MNSLMLTCDRLEYDSVLDDPETGLMRDGSTLTAAVPGYAQQGGKCKKKGFVLLRKRKLQRISK